MLRARAPQASRVAIYEAGDVITISARSRSVIVLLRGTALLDVAGASHRDADGTPPHASFSPKQTSMTIGLHPHSAVPDCCDRPICSFHSRYVSQVRSGGVKHFIAND